MMNASTAIRSYTNVAAETGVRSADSHKLIQMLYQGALVAIASAKNQIMRNEIAKKGKSISHAIAIIESGLQASLDKNVGGELAQNLSSLYDYMCMRLLTANLKNDAAALDEVANLLTELKNAWDLIRQPSTEFSLSDQPAPAKQTELTYRKV